MSPTHTEPLTSPWRVLPSQAAPTGHCWQERRGLLEFRMLAEVEQAMQACTPHPDYFRIIDHPNRRLIDEFILLDLY